MTNIAESLANTPSSNLASILTVGSVVELAVDKKINNYGFSNSTFTLPKGTLCTIVNIFEHEEEFPWCDDNSKPLKNKDFNHEPTIVYELTTYNDVDRNKVTLDKENNKFKGCITTEGVYVQVLSSDLEKEIKLASTFDLADPVVLTRDYLCKQVVYKGVNARFENYFTTQNTIEYTFYPEGTKGLICDFHTNYAG